MYQWKFTSLSSWTRRRKTHPVPWAEFSIPELQSQPCSHTHRYVSTVVHTLTKMTVYKPHNASYSLSCKWQNTADKVYSVAGFTFYFSFKESCEVSCNSMGGVKLTKLPWELVSVYGSFSLSLISYMESWLMTQTVTDLDSCLGCNLQAQAQVSLGAWQHQGQFQAWHSQCGHDWRNWRERTWAGPTRGNEGRRTS